MNPPPDYLERVKRQREEKDRFFAEHPRSPIPSDEREAFDGLDYFQPDPDFRFELDLHEHDVKESITIETTTDGQREYLRWGEFRFSVDGEGITLTAYKAEPDEDRLWVPFRDETNGEETYGAGRYLDLGAEEHDHDGTWIVDFNEAYNPYCAYSDRYECPLIPIENWLGVRIEAGERQYEGQYGH